MVIQLINKITPKYLSRTVFNDIIVIQTIQSYILLLYMQPRGNIQDVNMYIYILVTTKQ